jgi:hypothetical protein
LLAAIKSYQELIANGWRESAGLAPDFEKAFLVSRPVLAGGNDNTFEMKNPIL